MFINLRIYIFSVGKLFSAFFTTIVFLVSTGFGEALDPIYHSPDEIFQELSYFDSAYAQIASMELIGYSERDSMPFYGIHISDNPEIEEEEPGILILGQCHAEEVLGVEISMRLVRELCERYATDVHIRTLVRECSIWIIPTYNPEGLQVVHNSLDITYRKNKHDTNGNGEFDYEVGIGYDIDGVDLNRNYDFHWIHGDGYLVGDYDYYRGTAPFSESESRAIRDFVEMHSFLFSVAYHSARSGTPEIIYYPWEWNGGKTPPDYPQLTSIVNELASRIKRENGIDHYRVHPGTSRKGNAHNWFYGVKGIFQFLIECGTNNLQPDSAGMESVIRHNLPGLYYLMDRMIGYDIPAPMLTGNVVDALTEEPLEAYIKIEELDNDMILPRRSSALNGRFWRILDPGTYTIKVEKYGYLPAVIDNFVVNESFPTFIHIPLIPRIAVNLSISLESNVMEPLSFILYENGDPVLVDSVFSPEINLVIPAGKYRYTISGSDSLFYSDSLSIYSDSSFLLVLRDPALIFREPFNDLSGWTIADTVKQWVIDTDSTAYWALKSNSGQFYPHNYSGSIMMDSAIVIPDSGETYLVIKHKFTIEPIYDLIGIDLEIDQDSVSRENLASWYGEKRDFYRSIFSLNPWRGKSVRFRFWINTDGTLNDPGWVIDEFSVFHYDTTHQPESVTESALPVKFSVSNPYPNPFNPRAFFRIISSNDVQVEVYNLLGRKIRSDKISMISGNKGYFILEGKGMSSGLYFVKFQSGEKIQVRKCVLLK